MRAEKLKKSYQDVEVLKNVSLELGEGITGLTGPSGSGKSTLLRLLAGLDVPDSGQIERESDKIGFVFQENRLLPWLNVEENLYYVQAQRDPKKVEEVLLLTGLSGREKAMPDELSGGMQRRLALARALVIEPDVLFLDEPFTGLDEARCLSLIDAIQEICRTYRMKVLVVSHQTELLELLCPVIYTLKDLEDRT